MKLKSGCKVPFPERLEEGYAVHENSIIANVGADKAEDIMAHFIAMHNEPLFFILELPASLDSETVVSPGVMKKTHTDVYYIDGCSQEEALAVLSRNAELLINDGLASFGYGGHISHDEVMFGKYNILSVYSMDIEKYDEFFAAHDIAKKDDVITTPMTFDEDHPGISEMITIDGSSVYDIPEKFNDWGIYLAEQREDNV